MSTATDPRDAAGADGRDLTPRLTSEQVWRELGRASFAVVGHVTPDGRPRSSGVLYTIADHRLYVVVAADGWKARHIGISGQVAVTVPVRRGGLMSLLAPIPPATVSFHGTAVVRPVGGLDDGTAGGKLVRMVPRERRASCRIIEIVPEGWFVTYGIGVPLMRMRVPALARGRVPVA
ncbi:pyridoxamine 5'-phosphate oxidase family protein [Nonomuraea maheshkhaliensis]|uniref:Pyridoxamine 5'-phosphate oxidase family protein n=1 Tax=Nonomuraea maheshkhaliensis TaxID=419590 RepID=A0ABP4UA97_9ACTN